MDLEHPSTYDVAGITEWLRFIADGRPGGVAARLMVAPRSKVHIRVQTVPSGGVRVGSGIDKWRTFATFDGAAVIMAKLCAEAQFAAAVEARTLRARKALEARELLLRDMLGAARAQVADHRGAPGRALCDVIDDALNRLDDRYPHARAKIPRVRVSDADAAAALAARMDEVGL